MRKSALAAIVGVFVLALASLGALMSIWTENDAPSGDYEALDSPALPTAPITVLPVTPTASRLETAEVAEVWERQVIDQIGGAFDAWVVIHDADTGELVYEDDGAGAHRPASTMKILAGLYSLSELDGANTLKTTVSQAGGEIFLGGEGDLLLAANKGNKEEAVGYVGLLDLATLTAEALEEESIHAVSLAYQPTLFGDEVRNAAWDEQDVGDYAGNLAPFAVDTGKVAPGAWSYHDDPAGVAADLFAEHLESLGVTVSDVQAGQEPPDATVIAQVESAPIKDQVAHMLAVSDNTLAEQYCHLATQASGIETPSFADSADALKAFLVGENLAPDSVNIADCSGLDDDSRITGQVLVDALSWSQGRGADVGSVVRLLPVAGYTGTLTGRFDEDATSGNIHAKTGSLGATSTLAGVFTTASGQNLVFAVGTDNVPDTAGGWTYYYFDQFLVELAEK